MGQRELEVAPSAWDSELAKSANWKGKSHVASRELGVPPWSSDTRALTAASPCHTHSRFQPRRTAGSSAPLAERRLSFSATALAEGPGSREHSISLADFSQSLPPSIQGNGRCSPRLSTGFKLMSGNVPGGGQVSFPPPFTHVYVPYVSTSGQTDSHVVHFTPSKYFPQHMRLVNASAAERGRQCPGLGGRLSRRVGGGAWGCHALVFTLLPLSTGPVLSWGDRGFSRGHTGSCSH